MTCREKLAIEHPEKINIDAKGGCLGCPYDYGYLPVEVCSCHTERFADCEACWNREIPETEPTNIKVNLSEFINNVMKQKDKNVHIMIIDGNISIDVKPFTNTKHHWVYRKGEGRYEFECSECGYHHEFESPFCPECGEKLSKSEV